MNIRRPIKVTMAGVHHEVTLHDCPHCERGTFVFAPDFLSGQERAIGHLVLGAYDGPASMMSAACRGDVRMSMMNGIIRRRPTRMGAFMAGVRACIELRNM